MSTIRDVGGWESTLQQTCRERLRSRPHRQTPLVAAVVLCIVCQRVQLVPLRHEDWPCAGGSGEETSCG